MIIDLDKNQIIDNLKNIVSVSEKKQTMPILGNVLFKYADGVLLMVASDLELEISSKILVELEGGFETTLPGRKLLDILRSLNSGDNVKLNIEETKTTITSGKSKFVLATIPAEDFPYANKEVVADHKISVGDLDALISETSFSMAHQDARHFLNGMFMEVSPTKITTVATDGHRLAMSVKEAENSVTERLSCIIPRKCIIELKRIITSFNDNRQELIEFSLNNKEIMFKFSNYYITSKLIEGNYPDYNKVFPESLPNTLKIDKIEFKDALQRMSILSNDQFKGVKLAISSNELKLSTTNPAQEEGEDFVACSYSGENIEVGFNLNYLLEVIDVVTTDNLVLQLNNADSGCLLNNDSANPLNKYIIMPMRV